jgi:methylmalonyl-CoA/ethylmalonyl-CoA epimerase
MPAVALGKIEHVGLAVTDIDAAIAHYREVWGLEVTSRERVDDQGVEEVMLPLGGSHLQLLGATGPDTIVARFLRRRGEGLHHIAYVVDDLAATLDELNSRGVELIDRTPRRGGRGHLVAFVHPRSNHGLLVELIQSPATES